MAIEWPKHVTLYSVRKYTLIPLGYVELLVLISYQKWKQLINNRFCVILGLWNSSSSCGIRNFERYELKSESMQPAQQDSPNESWWNVRQEETRWDASPFCWYLFTASWLKLWECESVWSCRAGRNVSRMSYLLTVTCFWPRGMSLVPKACTFCLPCLYWT